MVKAVLIDMDNTLIETQAIYTTAHNSLIAYVMGCCNAEADEVMQKLQSRQLELFPHIGYAAEILPRAYADTFRHFVPDATERELEDCRRIANKVYETVAAVKPGVEEAIRELAKHFDLYLVTVGDQSVQQARVDQLPFKDVFKEIFIVSEKNHATYVTVLSKTGHEAHLAVMIGDSLTSDIVPAASAGLHTIHIPAANWAARELAGQKLPEKTEVHITFSAAVEILVQRHAPKNDNAAPAPKKNKGPSL